MSNVSITVLEKNTIIQKVFLFTRFVFYCDIVGYFYQTVFVIDQHFVYI